MKKTKSEMIAFRPTPVDRTYIRLLMKKLKTNRSEVIRRAIAHLATL